MNKTTRPTILLTACIRAISVNNNVCCSCIICISGLESADIIADRRMLGGFFTRNVVNVRNTLISNKCDIFYLNSH